MHKESQGTPLYRAAADGNDAEVRDLIRNGADVNEESTLLNQAINREHHATPLIIAAKLDHFKILHLLLAAGADANYQSSAGWTALMYAGANNNLKAAKLLIEKYGADATLRNKSGATAADNADRIYNLGGDVSIEMVKYLSRAEQAHG